MKVGKAKSGPWGGSEGEHVRCSSRFPFIHLPLQPQWNGFCCDWGAWSQYVSGGTGRLPRFYVGIRVSAGRPYVIAAVFKVKKSKVVFVVVAVAAAAVVVV